jgi:hypothetical protein
MRLLARTFGLAVFIKNPFTPYNQSEKRSLIRSTYRYIWHNLYFFILGNEGTFITSHICMFYISNSISMALKPMYFFFQINKRLIAT